MKTENIIVFLVIVFSSAGMGYAIRGGSPNSPACTARVESVRTASMDAALRACATRAESTALACREACALECGDLAARLDEGIDACAPLWSIADLPLSRLPPKKASKP